MTIVIYAISILYFILIFSFIVGFYRSQNFLIKNLPAKLTFSIVIPFRNETENLPSLLSSLQQLKYPTHLFEIIMVNDDSTDNSCAIIENFQKQFPNLDLTLLNNERKTNAPKKDAINTAISVAKYNWIVTTDADCTVPLKWLQCFNEYIETKKSVFISAPVKFKEENSLLFNFQNMNFLSLIGSTIGSFGINKPLMCNGANLCYKKDVFKNLNGFEGNTNIASGDDVFLLEKMHQQFPQQTVYLKSAEVIVVTNSEKSWSSYFNQQIRWASKTTAYKSIFSKLVGLIVLSMNGVLLSLPILATNNIDYWNVFWFLLLLKLTIDFVLIQKTSEFLQHKNVLKSYIIVALFQPFFTIAVGLFSIFKTYEWKGRHFKK